MPTLRTVTLNSGFDDSFEVSGVAWGGVERVRGFASLPSGKGVNQARTARELGVAAHAYSLVGAQDLDAFSDALEAEGIEHRLVAVPGRTRHNLTLLAGDEVAAHMVAEGFRLPDASPVRELIGLAADECRPGDVVSCNGSVPTGAPASVWAEAAARLRRAGAVVALDAQGEAMVQALQTGSVDLATPNEHEISALPGADGAASALRVMADYGVRFPVVTMGSRGAMFLSDGGLVRAECPVARPRQAVGAGDAFLAGMCAALLGGVEALPVLVSAGLAAAARHVGGRAESYATCLERVRFTAQ